MAMLAARCMMSGRGKMCPTMCHLQRSCITAPPPQPTVLMSRTEIFQSTRNPEHYITSRPAPHHQLCFRHQWCLHRSSLSHPSQFLYPSDSLLNVSQSCQLHRNYCSGSKDDTPLDQKPQEKPSKRKKTSKKKSGPIPSNEITKILGADDDELESSPREDKLEAGCGDDVFPGDVTMDDKKTDVSKEGVNEKKAPEAVATSLDAAVRQIKEQKDVKPVTDICFTLEATIKEHLEGWNMPYKQGYACLIIRCPRFPKRLAKGAKEPNPIYINNTTGYFVCRSCKKVGSWEDLKKNIDFMGQRRKARSKISACACDVGERSANEINQAASVLFTTSTPVTDIEPETLEHILDGLNIQDISKDTLSKFDVRVHPASDGIILPTFNFYMELEGVRVFRFKHVQAENGHSKFAVSQFTLPRVEYSGLFGWNVVNDSSQEIVITASEFDAMAIHQELGLSVLSLPRGDAHLPQNVLPRLEAFEKVTLWIGGDAKTWGNTKQFARKLNDSRCFLVRPDSAHPPPLLALQQGKNMKQILISARKILHKSIITFGQLRNEVFMDLQHSDEGAGVQWVRYPDLNKILKGHRRGELTVFTGPTGSGKTTFLSEYSLDLGMQGVNTLWGSFEISNVRLLRTMITQFAKIDLANNQQDFSKHADLFEQLPMYFMTFHGQQRVENVIETMSHAVYVHDIAHVIVDNLQFMMGCDGSNANGDRFSKQDRTVAALRQFATFNNCHVTLVIHPRKERNGDDLSINSIFGGAKASQEADNVFILQDRRLTSVKGRKYLQVAKNRYDGELGMFLLKFNKESLSYTIPTKTPKKEKVKDELSIGAMPVSSPYYQ